METKLIFYLVTMATVASGLTNSEEQRLILNSDTKIIDEKLRELPGGILVPPEISELPVPRDPGERLEFDKWGAGGPKFVRKEKQSVEERLRGAVVKSIRRLQTYTSHNKPSSSPSSSFSRTSAYPRYHTPSSSPPQTTPPPAPQSTQSSLLEIGLKRIEILSSRAGFNLSALPRRTQLQIVTKLTSKLPTKLQSVVKSSLKSNSPKIYELLPEPARDPLIEDNPSVLSMFLNSDEKHELEEEFSNSDYGNKKVNNLVSIATDGHLPQEDGGYEEFKVPEESSFSTNYERRVKFEEELPKAEELKSDPTMVGGVAEDDIESSPQESTRHEKTIKITRGDAKKPIRVSIISRDSVVTTTTTPPPTTTTPTTTTPPPILTKYINVRDFQNKTNLMFQLDQESNKKNEEFSDSDDYSDLSSSEIEAMVTELEKFEGNDNSLEFSENPHELEFPDHPEHPKNEELKGEELELKRLREEIEGRRKMQQQQGGNNRRRNKPPHFPSHLIRRPPPPPLPRRPRPPPHNFPPPPPRPLKINDVKVQEAPKEFDKECDYFSDQVCLLVQDYPIEAISDAVESNPSLTQTLIVREDPPSENHTPSQSLSSEGGFLCPSKVAYGKIKKAKSSTTGKWKFIVNYGDKTQTLRLEKCLTPGDKCSYILPHYRTACTQVFNYHRLVAWDFEGGLHLDTFKVPITCTCHVQGYYSPFTTPPPPPQSPLQPHRRRISLPHPPLPRNLHRNPAPSRNPSPSTTSDSEDLTDLLKQYATLRDKIAKRKSVSMATTNSNSRMLNLIENVLLRKKRKNSTSQKPSLQKILKKIQSKNKKITKSELITVAKKRLKNLKSRDLKIRRSGRNLKNAKNNKNSTKKSQKLLKILKSLKKSAKKSNNAKKSKVNYNYHPIMDYIK